MIPASVRIFVCTRPHDMRCSYDMLAAPAVGPASDLDDDHAPPA